jgi:hypothetical protein
MKNIFWFCNFLGGDLLCKENVAQEAEDSGALPRGSIFGAIPGRGGYEM